MPRRRASRASCMLSALVTLAPLPTTDALADPPARPEPAATRPAATAGVEPVGEWLRFDEVEWRGEPIALHLRTGYERPLILPEPVTLPDPTPLPGCRVSVDVEVVSFAPAEHFPPRPVVLVGERTGTRYRFTVRSDVTGHRIPLHVTRR